MPRPIPPRPFPFSPLEQLEAQASDGELAKALGITRRTVFRYRESGLTFDQADRFAIAVGFHPAEVWPTWIDEALDDLEEASA